MDWKEQQAPDIEDVFLRGAGIKALEPPTNEDIEYENDLGFPDTSRYKYNKVIKYEDGTCFRLWQIPEFPNSETDSFYQVPAGEVNRLDLISSTIYGTVDLWWVLATVNNIADPFVEVEAGKLLRVPAITEVYSKLVEGI